jgi:hypothetical protein
MGRGEYLIIIATNLWNVLEIVSGHTTMNIISIFFIAALLLAVSTEAKFDALLSVDAWGDDKLAVYLGHEDNLLVKSHKGFGKHNVVAGESKIKGDGPW